MAYLDGSVTARTMGDFGVAPGLAAAATRAARERAPADMDRIVLPASA